MANTAKSSPHLGNYPNPKIKNVASKKRGTAGFLGTNILRLYVLGTGSGLGGAQPLGEALNLDHNKLEKRTRELLRSLHGMKCSMPVTEPGYKRYKGLFLRITQGEGKSSGVKPAIEKFKEALTKAEGLGLQLETALCHYEIGRHSQFDDASRKYHLQTASRIFKGRDVGAAELLSDVESELSVNSLKDAAEFFMKNESDSGMKARALRYNRYIPRRRFHHIDRLGSSSELESVLRYRNQNQAGGKGLDDDNQYRTLL